MKKNSFILVLMLLLSIKLNAQDSICIDSYYIRNSSLNSVLDSVAKKAGKEPIAYALQLVEKDGDLYCCFSHMNWPIDLINEITGRNPVVWGPLYKFIGCVQYNNLSVYVISKIKDELYLKYLSRLPISTVIKYDSEAEDDIYFLYKSNIIYKIKDNQCFRVVWEQD